MWTVNMATKPTEVAGHTIDSAQLEFALESTVSAALTAATIFCQQCEAAAAEPEVVRAFLEREYALTLLAATDPCTDHAALTFGNSYELVAVVLAAQEVAEYTSTWLQIRRLGRAVVQLPFEHTIADFEASPLDYAKARTRRLCRELQAIIQTPTRPQHMRVLR